MATLSASPSLDQLLLTLSGDGRDFERLCKWFLENDPVWSAIFRRVWLWDEWPEQWGRDRGIDLIAEAHDGRIFAVQAKNYGAAHSITKSDVDKFLSESNRPAISERLLIASTDRVARSAIDVMRAQEKRVTTCLLENLRLSELDWPASVADLAPAELATYEPRDHQEEALDAIGDWAKSPETRGQVVMACATGKSLVGVWAADRLGADKVVVLVPTLALLRQTAATWTRHASTARRLVLVCSDYRRSEAEDISKGDELGNLRTTHPAAIAEALRTTEPLLMVCTYNSSPALAKAMEGEDAAFDLAIADEAHRCAGLESSSHKTILDDAAICAQRRLFFTATPTIYGTRDKGRAADKNVRLASMDDRAQFGPVIHHLSFAEATERGLLCPYQVAVIPVYDDEVHQLISDHRIVTPDGDERVDAASLATQIACARAMRRFGCRRMVAFQPSIPHSKRFSKQFGLAATLLSDEDAPDGSLWSEHVDGADMTTARRAQILRRFRANEPNEHRLLSNVKLLAEGVDIPSIDAVAFIDTRRGQASIIQAVGRAVRLAEGKSVGTIVLPVVLRHGESLDAALTRSEHRAVVDILGALRSHDPEIARSLDDLRYSYHPGSTPTTPGRFVVDAPVEVGAEFADAVGLALADALGVSAPRSMRRRRQAAQPRIVEPQPEPTDEEKFQIGLGLLWSAGRFDLLPHVPDRVGEFPLRVWWDEAKQRWLSGTLDLGDRREIAWCVSWLAADLQGEDPIRLEMATLTDAGVPEQVVSQLRPGGRFTTGSLAPLADDPAQVNELLEPISSIHRAVTHAAMSPEEQLRKLDSALAPLATALRATSEELDPEDWYWESRRLATVGGFADTLTRLDRRGRSDSAPKTPWRSHTEPEAYAAGVAAARNVESLVLEQLPFQFRGDRAAVERRRAEEVGLSADEKLDELGWEIFLLARSRGGNYQTAVGLAMDGNFHQRQLVREDLLSRWLRDNPALAS